MARSEHPPAFLLYAQDFVSDSKVEAMTTREVGAYFLLLCKAWYENPVGTIPNDDRVLARWARMTPDEWAECRDAVISPFKACPDNRLLSSRLSSEFRKLMESRKRKSDAGKASAHKRWGDCNRPNGCVVTDPMPTHDSVTAVALTKNAISFSRSRNTKTTPPLPPAGAGGERADDFFDSFAASLSGEYQEVIAAWKEATGIPCSPDPNTREGARILAKAIAEGEFPRKDLVPVIKAGMSDPNLPSQGLRGVANNRCRYLPKASSASRSPPQEQKIKEARWLMRCDACGYEGAIMEPEDNGQPKPAACWNPLAKTKCTGMMRILLKSLD